MIVSSQVVPYRTTLPSTDVLSSMAVRRFESRRRTARTIATLCQR